MLAKYRRIRYEDAAMTRLPRIKMVGAWIEFKLSSNFHLLPNDFAETLVIFAGENIDSFYKKC